MISGEMRVKRSSKQAVTKQVIDVPLAHEQVVISQRGRDDFADDGGTFGEEREILTPLRREAVAIDQRVITPYDLPLTPGSTPA